MAAVVTAVTRPAIVIRLVGGPVRLDGSRVDADDPHDRADCDGNRLVRVVRGPSDRAPVGSLAALVGRCSDRATAESLAGEWLGVVYAYGRDRRLRTRYYRHQSTHHLVATRDGGGGWTLALGQPVSGRPAPGRPCTSEHRSGSPTSNSTGDDPSSEPTTGRGVDLADAARTDSTHQDASPRSPICRSGTGQEPSNADLAPRVSSRSAAEQAAAVSPLWDALEDALDGAASRFGAIAALLPDGPTAERAASARTAVGACVRDGARLCEVGRITARGWTPDSAVGEGHGPSWNQAQEIAGQVAALIATIDEATSHLVDLHLAVGADLDHALDLVEPVAHISVAMSELPR